MVHYTSEELEKFAKGMRKASDIVRSKKPDFIFAPVLGSVPFVDLMYLVDRHFDLGAVEYPPNSSRFSDREGIMAEWYGSFLDANYRGSPMSIICLDEVISGSSAVKGYNEFQKALYEFSERKHTPSVRKDISYHFVGLGEKPKRGGRTPSLSRIVNAKKANIIEVGNLITADNPLLNPVRLKSRGTNKQGRHIYVPEIERFEITPEYISLLQNFAACLGADPSKVSVQNLGKIQESLNKYLENYQPKGNKV